jgi:hypothetical protein
MPRLKDVDSAERNQWVLERFREDPTISQPKMQKLVHERYKNTMRARKIYELRNIVLEELGWQKDQFGNPVPPKRAQEVSPALGVPALRPAAAVGETLTQANRLGEGEMMTADNLPNADVYFKTCLVPVRDEEDAASFSQKLNLLRSKGHTTLKVDTFTKTYAVVSRD